MSDLIRQPPVDGVEVLDDLGRLLVLSVHRDVGVELTLPENARRLAFTGNNLKSLAASFGTLLGALGDLELDEAVLGEP